MNEISRIKHLYAYEDGDTITPRMGVQIAQGYGLQQFYNSENWQVTNTDLSQHPATLFPQPYSGKAGSVVVPASGGQWYLNNVGNTENAILDANGNVKSAFADRFEVTTVTLNGKIFPALTIKANLVNSTNRISADIYIFYVGTYNGKPFTCEQCIPVQAVVGNAYQLLVSAVGADGVTGDEVLADDNDFVEYTAFLQLVSTGTPIDSAVITFEHFGDNGWEAVSHVNSRTEISDYVSGSTTVGKKLKLYEVAVDGQELYRAKAVFNGKTYYKVMEPTDVHDPYYIIDGCSIAGETVQQGETAVFAPSVYKRHYGVGEEDEDVTITEGWSFSYVVVRQDTGATVTGLDPEAGIPFATIKGYKGISVRIQASRS